MFVNGRNPKPNAEKKIRQAIDRVSLRLKERRGKKNQNATSEENQPQSKGKEPLNTTPDSSDIPILPTVSKLGESNQKELNKNQTLHSKEQPATYVSSVSLLEKGKDIIGANQNRSPLLYVGESSHQKGNQIPSIMETLLPIMSQIQPPIPQSNIIMEIPIADATSMLNPLIENNFKNPITPKEVAEPYLGKINQEHHGPPITLDIDKIAELLNIQQEVTADNDSVDMAEIKGSLPSKRHNSIGGGDIIQTSDSISKSDETFVQPDKKTTKKRNTDKGAELNKAEKRMTREQAKRPGIFPNIFL